MVQVLPANNSFGDRFAESLAGFGSKVSQGLQQRYAEESLMKILGAGSTNSAGQSNVNSEGQGQLAPEGNSLAETDPLRLAQIHKAATRARGDKAADSLVRSIESQGKEKNKLAREKRREEVEAFKLTNEYREHILGNYESAQSTLTKLGQMEKLNDSGKLTSASAAKISESLGIPLSILANPESEEFDKLSNNLTSGITKNYGNKILLAEFQNFLKQIPTLMNSQEGRARIIKNMKVLLEPDKLAYQAYKDIRKEGGKTPLDLHEKVLEKIEPQLQKLADEFNKDNDRSKQNNFVMGKDPFGKVRQIPMDKIQEFTNAGGVLE